MQTETLGGLRCHWYDELPGGASPKLIVVLCHGFGASGTDLVGLAPEILRRYPNLRASVRFLFPEAPTSMEPLGMPDGRAWWMLDMDKLNAAIARGEIRDLRNDHPPELPCVREKFFAMLDAVKEQTGLPMSQFVLGGFSQGAMVTTDITLRLPEPPAMLTVFSGTLLAEDEWRELAAKRGPLQVLQSHGDEDMILPFTAAEWLRDLFTESGFTVEFLPFRGPHTIPESAFVRLAERLQELTAG